MKLLVATDFSPAAAAATDAAIALGRRLGGSLVLVRAVEPPPILYPEMAGAEVEGMELGLQNGVRAELAEAAAQVRERLAGAAVTVEEAMVFGFPEQVLAEYARAHAVDLVLMGAQAHGPVSRLLFGSVTERTVTDSPCPVLVVHEGERPFAAWAERPLRVMVAPGPDLGAAGHWLSGLRAAAAPAEVVEIPPPQLEGELSVVGEALAEQATPDKVDLLILGTQQRRGWQRLSRGSTAVTALRSVRVPLLCVPDRS